MSPVPGAQVPPMMWELRSHMQPKKKKKRKDNSKRKKKFAKRIFSSIARLTGIEVVT